MQKATGPNLAVAGTHAPTRINTTNTTLCTGLESHLTHSDSTNGQEGASQVCLSTGLVQSGVGERIQAEARGEQLDTSAGFQGKGTNIDKMEMGGETRCADWAS